MNNKQTILDDYTLYDVLEIFKNNFLKELNIFKVGIINKVHYEDQTVDVSIASKMPYVLTNETYLKEYPYLVNVPYICLGGNKGALTLPIDIGDECLLCFNDEDFTQWYETGKSLPPYENRKHNLSDCFALIGLRNVNRLIQTYSEFVKLWFKDEDGESHLELKNTSADLIVNGESTSTINLEAKDNVELKTDLVHATKKMTVEDDTTLKKKLIVEDNATFQKNISTTLNTESATYSTGGVAGISGVFVNSAGQKLIFTNGLITAIQ